jgi:hypothetical protein
MIDYGTVYQRVDSFLQTREGLANPKKAQDYVWFVRELTGIFCGAAFEHDMDTGTILNFFDLVERHEISNVDTSGQLVDVSNLIDDFITSHPLYEITEFTLMNYKPGNVQVGPGEFFFCFYDAGSTFGIDNQAGFDIITDRTTTELKKLGSNFTDEALFDGYAESEDVDRLMVVHPVSNAKKPMQRSKYACTPTTEWRKAFYHRGKAGTLALVG